MKNTNFLLLVIILFFVSCTKAENLSPDTSFTGKWGGQGINVVATDIQVAFDFDCATGIINKKAMLNNNIFSEKGTYTQSFGNIPININPPEAKSVIYEGVLSGNNLVLNIKSEDGKTLIGKYTIVKNELGKVVKCM